MRAMLHLALLFGALACGPSPHAGRLIAPGIDGGSAIGWPELLSEHPMPAGRPVHAIEVDRSADASHHVVQVRGAEAPHVHRTHDLTVVVVQGAGVLTIGERQVTVASGDIVLIPRGTMHFFRNTGREPAVAFTVFTPAFDGLDVLPVGP